MTYICVKSEIIVFFDCTVRGMKLDFIVTYVCHCPKFWLPIRFVKPLTFYYRQSFFGRCSLRLTSGSRRGNLDTSVTRKGEM